VTIGGVMAVFAHPDDESLLSGGTLAACAAAGERVEVLCMTRGDLGEGSGDGTSGSRREDELRLACAELGVERVECLDHGDGELSWIERDPLIDELAARLRAAAPRVVITFGNEGLYWHDDHVAVHEIVVAAYDRAVEGSYSALYAATWPRGLAAELIARMEALGLPARLWGLAPDAFGVQPDAITTTVDAVSFVGAKLRALKAHRSQVPPGHLLHEVPLDIAADLLGREHFVQLRGRSDPLPALALGEEAASR
jgi:LmbE family N-acetylglucosaminyl deacetylase